MNAPNWQRVPESSYIPAVFYPAFVGTLLSNIFKDLRLEWRSKDAINAMLFFALLVAVIFSFSFQPTAEEARQIVGGLVWVALL
ncbi:MAG: heme exporter protein CcmB, partial [Acidobacteriales bacterium]|nr:heme exporter protein CcmB [Terriglobales bacterium]